MRKSQLCVSSLVIPRNENHRILNFTLIMSLIISINNAINNFTLINMYIHIVLVYTVNGIRNVINTVS